MTLRLFPISLFTVLIVLCSCDDAVVLPRVKIASMHVESKIHARMARVLVTTQMKNFANQSLETQFTFQLPDTAFISNFTMYVGDKSITAIVKEKKEANKIYEESKQQGVSAAKIDRQDDTPNREMKIFTVSVNVAAESKSIFKLQYHELLSRKFGYYKQRISFQPRQIVQDLVFRAKIFEQEGINKFHYTLPGSNTTETSSNELTTVKASDNTRELYFKPAVDYQKDRDISKGISGEVVLHYDVEHNNVGGIILQENEYFVHYLAPTGFTVLHKNIIFIIDISGSMQGLKIEQTKLAMLSILDQLHTGDYFNILLFDNNVKEWFSEPMLATLNNVNLAKTFVHDKVHARGSTDINTGLLRGISLLDITQSLGGTRGNIIVFLTDGRPTSGITKTKSIRQGVTAANKHKFSIFSLGFGFDVDMPFLKALSWENGGFARRVYEESDASSQLESFYKELENPTLIDVKIDYPNNAVELSSLTSTRFPQYFKGSELIIAGKINDHFQLHLDAHVQGQGSVTNLDTNISSTAFKVGSERESSFMEKLWAYMKINDLLKETALTDDEVMKMILKNKTLELSLKYNFVTPLTSMVVSETFLPRKIGYDQDMLNDPGVDRSGYVPFRNGNRKAYMKSKAGRVFHSQSSNFAHQPYPTHRPDTYALSADLDKHEVRKDSNGGSILQIRLPTVYCVIFLLQFLSYFSR
ncbi:inter-alpha-trypsin inhibitor heavy chain H4-like [Mytilus trossulus]|uniref:inter-alpha-trypsin inhibitor heavy chain H4-like n=1 Tax=Mytilus trossulus TaxID=6551 RepID=UPI003004074E